MLSHLLSLPEGVSIAHTGTKEIPNYKSIDVPSMPDVSVLLKSASFVDYVFFAEVLSKENFLNTTRT